MAPPPTCRFNHVGACLWHYLDISNDFTSDAGKTCAAALTRTLGGPPDKHFVLVHYRLLLERHGN
eukprot:3151471-Amphidinium_carterae.1